MSMSMHEEVETTGKETQQINPSILIIIIILAVIFFLSCCLHILIRFHVRIPPRTVIRSASSSSANVAGLVTLTALQAGQLHHLFHIQQQEIAGGGGLPQAFIDTLPLFLYKSLMGASSSLQKRKNAADCVVCLSEFEPQDRLRLLPQCSHAFHVDCIDTWLLCHSTCPLCRCHVLNEDDGFDLLETGQARGGGNPPAEPVNAPIGLPLQSHVGSSRVVPVQLGKFRFQNTIHGEASSSSNNNNDNNGRSRSYSLGSYEYVVDASDLRHVYIVPTHLSSQRRRFLAHSTRGCHRSSLSDSTALDRDTCLHQPVFDRLFPSLGALTQWGPGEQATGSSSLCADVRVKTPAMPGRGSVSFHVPPLKKVVNSSSRRSYSETQLPELAEHHHPTSGLEFEPYSVSGRASSFARRTINWLTGRQKSMVHASSSSSIISTTSTTTASLNPQLDSSKQDIETGV